MEERLKQQSDESQNVPLITTWDRAKYFVSAAATVGGTIELLGGGGMSLVFGAGAGALAAYLSPEIRGFLIDHMPAPGGVNTRRSKLSWLLTGQMEQEQRESNPEPLRELEPMEPLQPRPVHNVGSEDALSAPTFLPDGPFRFSDILKTFTPSLNKIYLATLPDGTHVFTSARDLCHTALAGATRGGKDHLIRQLMSQLCYVGANVYLLDPNYKRYDLESVDPWKRPYPEDWTPFEQHLKNDPRELINRDRTYKVIEHYLKEACALVEHRLEILGHSKQRLGAHHFIFINELPAIVDEVPNTVHYLKKILREGAKVGVFLVNASQDFQVGTVFKDVGGGIRKCYRTGFDVGTDPATQNALGLLPLKGLGKGRASLRNDVVTSEARVPWVENEALYALLGPSTYIPSAKQQHTETVLHPYQPDSDERESIPEPRAATQPATQEVHTRRRVAMSGYEANQRRKREETAIRREWHSVRKEAPANEPRQAQAKQDEQMRDGRGYLVTEMLAHDEELERGIVAYKKGATTLDALMAELTITQHAARKLKPRIEKALREHQSI